MHHLNMILVNAKKTSLWFGLSIGHRLVLILGNYSAISAGGNRNAQARFVYG